VLLPTDPADGYHDPKSFARQSLLTENVFEGLRMRNWATENVFEGLRMRNWAADLCLPRPADAQLAHLIAVQTTIDRQLASQMSCRRRSEGQLGRRGVMAQAKVWLIGRRVARGQGFWGGDGRGWAVLVIDALIDM
jgi:branched-subunit amino acid aminotransferase/4-amino-4-deoxychorismate lyase